MPQSTSRSAGAAGALTCVLDRKVEWFKKEIWPEIEAMMHHDAYFKVWLKAMEFAGVPYGPIAQTIVNGYITYQLAAIRRICDRRTRDDIIALPKLLRLIAEDLPQTKSIADQLIAQLKGDCGELYQLATKYIAHNADPADPNRQAWMVTSDKVAHAQQAICEVGIQIERDLLSLAHRVAIVPVPQFDNLAEVKAFVPAGRLNDLQDFWHDYNTRINTWAQVPRLE